MMMVVMKVVMMVMMVVVMMAVIGVDDGDGYDSGDDNLDSPSMS